MTTPTQDLNSNSKSSNQLDLSEAANSAKDEARLVQWVKTQYDQMKNARTPVERQWYLNMSFYYGRQNVQWLTTTASTLGYKLYTPPAPPWRVRLVINKVRSIIRTELAKLTSQKPMFTVVPATNEDEDFFAAQAAEKIFDYIYDAKKVQRVVKQAGWWALVCGVSYIKNYWDSTLIDELNNQKGDVVYEYVTPFHILVPDLREWDLERQPYIIHAQTKTVDWVNSRYKTSISGKSVKPNAKAANDILDDSFLNLIGAKPNVNEEVLMLEVWIKPNGHPNFPKGGLVTVVDEQVVYVKKDAFPYAHGKYPFAKLEHIPSGKYYSTSVIEDLIAIQREYNRTRSQIVESKNRMAKPQLLAPKGSIDAKKVTSEPGQIIEYTIGLGVPTALTLSNLPSYVLESLNLLQSDMDDISSQHEITRGQTPPQVTAATAISFLQEQDDSKLSHTIETLEDGIEKLGKMTLAYISEYWTTPRLVTAIGHDSAFEAAVYKGADLKGYNDVRVEAGSALSTSKAAKQAFIMDMMKNQLIPADKGLEVLDLAGLNRLYADIQTDVRQAQRENLKMASGDSTVAANDWDNHQLHVERHNQYRKTEEFETLDPGTKALFQNHVLMHQMAMNNQMMTQQLQQGIQNPGMQQQQPGIVQQGQPGGM